ncbi:MAG: AraC family transcriptional regulator [Cyclobacteriaceae bacterium]|nr:AraC family transcriptional regulator [Cyclobacteriaceae bacterium]
MTLYIKNMVCDRCKMVVTRELEKQNINFKKVELGEITLVDKIEVNRLKQFKENIERLGFELIDDKKSKLIEKVKTEIINLIYKPNAKLRTNLSAYLADKIGKDYSSISSLFSEVEGTTIEQYFIHQKIERVKELLVYDELSLSQIADQLTYSSVQHLSKQFKQVIGLTPSHFKKLRDKTRKSLDKV